MNEVWWKDGVFYRKLSPYREVQIYGVAVDSKGDLIFNTCKKIINDLDQSEWAFDSVLECSDLLNTCKRWPDRMNQDIDSKTIIEHLTSKILFALYITEHVKFGRQNHMTRDPYIALYCACFMMDNYYLIKRTPPPWYLYTPVFWSWYKFLLTGKAKYRKRFFFFQQFTSHKGGYVEELNKLMESVFQLTK